MRFLSLLLLGLCCAGSALAQGIPLDRLNNCDDMARMAQWLDAGAATSPSQCRAPKNDLEKRLLSNWNSAFSSQKPESCMTPQSSLDSLAGFDCMETRLQTTRTSFFCFRRMNAAPLNAYREKYAQVYAKRVADYIAKSGSCNVVTQAGHMARIAGVSLPPPALLAIAKPAFSFESKLKAARANARVEHGFAFLDPTVATGAQTGIEYVTADFGNSVTADKMKEETTSAGKWTVDSVTAPNMLDIVSDIAQANPVAAGLLASGEMPGSGLEMSAVYLNVSAPEPLAVADTDKSKMLHAWGQQVGQSLRSLGLNAVSEAELAQQGVDTSMFENGLGPMMPYGLQSAASRMKPHFGGAWAGTSNTCGHAGGAYLVFGLEMPPGTARRGEFGILAFMVASSEGCSKGAGGPGAEPLIANLTKALVGHLKEH